jgi:hypothetical protein
VRADRPFSRPPPRWSAGQHWPAPPRARTRAIAVRRIAADRSCALLDAHWPGAKAAFINVASPISRAFLTRYPTPASARHLGEKRMAALFVAKRVSGLRRAQELTLRAGERRVAARLG